MANNDPRAAPSQAATRSSRSGLAYRPWRSPTSGSVENERSRSSSIFDPSPPSQRREPTMFRARYVHAVHHQAGGIGQFLDGVGPDLGPREPRTDRSLPFEPSAVGLHAGTRPVGFRDDGT